MFLRCDFLSVTLSLDGRVVPCDALLHYRPSLCVPSSSPQHQYLTEALHWRAQTDADHVLFVLLNAKVIIILVIPCFLRKKKALPFHLTVTNGCFFFFPRRRRPPGGGSEHGNLCAAAQAGGEDCGGADRERQHQHGGERGAALPPRWALPPSVQLSQKFTTLFSTVF